MYRPLKTTVAALALGAAFTAPSFAQDLVINFDDLNPDKKQAFDDVVAAFQEQNPDMEIEVNNQDRDAYKTAIRNFLTADPPDVAAWYPGNRMAPYVESGLFEPITDLWESEGMDETFASIKPTMSMNGEVWGVPYSYYQWGIYYRQDIMQELGVEVPGDWDELLAACATIDEAGKDCFAIGTKALWPAAGMFDYLNLRTNGYEFHNELTAGNIPYTDDRVRATFENWRQLVEPGYIIDNHATMEWQDALASFISGDSVMYVIGNFAVNAMLEGGLTEDQIGYASFPTINPDVGRAEDAPADALFMPSGAKNKDNARKFLAFVASAEIQTQWNLAINQLPPNADAQVGDSKFLQQGFETLSTAEGLAQFYDRDASAAMAQAGMEGFQEFMVKPDRLDSILERLEKARQRDMK